MPKKRNANKRKLNKRILILCEGKQTEPDYFRGLKHDKMRRNRLAALRIEIFDTEKTTGKELISEAKRLKKIAERERNPYNEIWVVFDRDGYTKHPQTLDQAYSNKIEIAFSSISFEFWFLLHFEYSTKAFEKADSLISYLKKHLPDYSKCDDNYEIQRKGPTRLSSMQ